MGGREVGERAPAHASPRPEHPSLPHTRAPTHLPAPPTHPYTHPSLSHLEVHHHEEDGDGGEELEDVGHLLAVKGVLERARLVGAREQKVEERDDSPFKLGAPPHVEGVGGEGLRKGGWCGGGERKV